jgi:flavin prenyltransferase
MPSPFTSFSTTWLSRSSSCWILSRYAQAVIAEELRRPIACCPEGVQRHGLSSMNLPFASGSNPCDAMVVIPCSMGTLGRIAHGISNDALLRTADVTLKERRKLILVPRETPLSLVHVSNFELLLLAGAVILPANPSFYSSPARPEKWSTPWSRGCWITSALPTARRTLEEEPE